MCFIIESYERFNMVHITDTSVQYNLTKTWGMIQLLKKGWRDSELRPWA